MFEFYQKMQKLFLHLLVLVNYVAQQKNLFNIYITLLLYFILTGHLTHKWLIDASLHNGCDVCVCGVVLNHVLNEKMKYFEEIAFRWHALIE